jgi:general secretion pathway protein M
MTWPFADQWQARTARERVLIGLMMGVATLWVAITLIWQPIMQERARLAGDIARYDRAIAALNAMAAGGPVAPPVVDDAALPVIITDTAANFALTIRRLQPAGDSVQVTLEDAPFDAVLFWIEALERDHGLRVQTLDLSRRPAPGVVSTNLTVGR